jgi:hypothetical protein
LRNQGTRFDPARTGTTKQPKAIPTALHLAHFTPFTPAPCRTLAHTTQRGGFVALGKKYLSRRLGGRISHESSVRI